MTADPPGASQVWRGGKGGRVAAVVAGGGWLAFAFGALVAGASIGGFLAYLGAFAVIAVVLWRCYFVPFVAITDEALIVQTRLQRHVLPFDEVTSVEPGRVGLVIRRRSQLPLVVFGVASQPPWASWLKRTDRPAHRIARTIEGHLSGAPAPE